MLLSERYGTLRVRRRPLSAHGQNSQRDIKPYHASGPDSSLFKAFRLWDGAKRCEQEKQRKVTRYGACFFPQLI